MAGKTRKGIYNATEVNDQIFEDMDDEKEKNAKEVSRVDPGSRGP